MIKAALILCSLCAAAGGTAYLVKSDSETPTAAAIPQTMPSFLESHGNAHLDNLPLDAVKR